MKKNVKKKLIYALTEENFRLRQAVHPDDRKKLPPAASGIPEKEKLELSKIKPVFGIIIALLLILIVFIIEISILSEKKVTDQKIKEEEQQSASTGEYIPDSPPVKYNLYGNTAGNLLNGGLAAVQGDWIYINADSRAIYKKNLADGTVKKITDENAEQLNIIGERIYYVLSETRQLYSIRTDGNDLKRLGLISCHTMQVINKGDSVRIYYIDFADKSLRSCNINGENQEIIVNDICSGFFFHNNKLYYYTSAGLFDNNGKIIIENAYDFIPDDDFIYFIKNTDGSNELYRYGVISGESEDLNINALFYNVFKNDIYYYNETGFMEPTGFIELEGIILYHSDINAKKNIIYDAGYKYFNLIKDRTYYRGKDGRLYSTDWEGTQRELAY